MQAQRYLQRWDARLSDYPAVGMGTGMGMGGVVSPTHRSGDLDLDYMPDYMPDARSAASPSSSPSPSPSSSSSSSRLDYGRRMLVSLFRGTQGHDWKVTVVGTILV